MLKPYSGTEGLHKWGFEGCILWCLAFKRKKHHLLNYAIPAKPLTLLASVNIYLSEFSESLKTVPQTNVVKILGRHASYPASRSRNLRGHEPPCPHRLRRHYSHKQGPKSSKSSRKASHPCLADAVNRYSTHQTSLMSIYNGTEC